MEVGAATADRSPFGCRDMFGNGKEWTRSLYAESGKEVPAEHDSTTLVVLRGRSYMEKEPLSYEELMRKGLGKEPPDTEGYDEVRGDIGFRIVIETEP